MSLSHQDKEAQTLLSYFKQMLSEDDRDIAAATQAVTPALMEREDKAVAPIAEDQVKTSDLAEAGLHQEQDSADNAYTVQPQPLPEATAAGYSLPTKDRPDTQSLEQLLSSIDSAVKTDTDTQQLTAVQTETQTAVETAVNTETALKTETAVQTENVVQHSQVQEQDNLSAQQEQAAMQPRFDPVAWRNLDTLEEFQTLFFMAQGVRFAVPLIDLGGIFEYDKLTTLFGKPQWYLGMTDIRGYKINVVDTLRWVNPAAAVRDEKYPYIISLGQSLWALGCDELEGNRTIARSAVKWRQTPGSRPWLAGIVKDERCALLHVPALIGLCTKGMGQDEIIREIGTTA